MSMSENAIAIVGIDLNIPGCQNVDEYWDVLVNSIECIKDIPISIEDIDNVDKNYINRASACKDYDKFDASFFGFSKHEARVMDPQHRLFLQACWRAVENAGYKVSELKGNVGVFGSAGYNTYLVNALSKDSKYVEKNGHYDILVGNDKDYFATRVSHKLGLNGPSITVQCACSSSLVDVHLACQSLLMGESDMCLAGAANVRVPCEKGYNYQTGFFLSEDGHCRAYDDKGTGTVFGSGVGVVVLKRLEDAIADKDFIYSIIRVTSINNDGNRKIGYTAPSFEGQTDVTQTALNLEKIELESIRFIEGHGTGTVLGDPIELNSIKNTFSLSNSEDNKRFPCAIGSVKSNIGHLDAAAGIAGLIKASLCLLHRKIVPTLYFDKLNSKTSFENTRFYVANKVEEIEKSIYPNRAVVSAFGVGGTNACVILEEPPISSKAEDDSSNIFLAVVSAKSENSLDYMIGNVMKLKEESNIGSKIYTINTAREEFSYRAYVLFQKEKCDSEYHIINTSKIYDVREMNSLRCTISIHNSDNNNWKTLYCNNKTYKELFDEWIKVCYGKDYNCSQNIDVIDDDKEKSNVISQVAFAELLKICCPELIFDNIILQRYVSGEISKTEYAKTIISEIHKHDINKTEKSVYIIDDISEEKYYETLGRAWISGLTINWNQIFHEKDKTRCPAPMYEFEKKRYWFDDDKSLVWKAEKSRLNEITNTIKNRHYIFGKNDKIVKKIYEGLNERNIETVYDEEWDSYSVGDDVDRFSSILNINKYSDVKSLSVVFAINTDDTSPIDIFFYKYIKILQWLSNEVPTDIEVIIRIVQVKGDDTKLFENSMLLEGITNTLPKELPNIRVKQIICDDIDDYVIEEIINNDNEMKVFVEKGERYGISYTLSEQQEEKTMLKEGGNYIITGGTGNVGLLFLKEISRRVKANIILISKNYNEEKLYLGKSEKEIAIQNIIDRVRKLGNHVEIVQTDISDLKKWRNVLKELKQKYSNIDGIIHAAGKAGKARDFIGDVSLTTINEYLGAKVNGAHEIETALFNDNIDFCIYVSSTTSILGGIGDSVYAGVNAVLNQMASKKSHNGCSVFSVLLDSMPRVFEDEYVSKDDSKVKKLLLGQLTQQEFSIVCNTIFSNSKGENLIISKTDFQDRFVKEKEIREYSNNIIQETLKNVENNLNDYIYRIRGIWQKVLEVRCEKNINFFDAGGDSFLAVKVIAELNHEFQVNLPIQFIYEFSTIELMAKELYNRNKGEKDVVLDLEKVEYDNSNKKSTFVIGMAGRFPDADNIDELWENLLEGKKSISHFELDEYENVLTAEPDGKNNKYVGARGIINDVDKFDFHFFGISKLEAQLMDPQQRLFIQTVWNALEDSGCINMLGHARIGVFASQGISTYLLNVLLKSDKIKTDYNNIAVLNNSPDSLATRVSYLLDLTGVSKTIQSFCSSSMVALEDAITYIEKGKCDLAVVGGSNIVVPQKSGYIYNESSICSATGDVRPFDDSADGTVFGNAVGVVVLANESWVKKYKLHSYAEIIGVGINNDGSQKANYLSPSIKGQAECVAEAYAKAGISSSQVCFIETHGTATHVGDPIEIHALKKSFEYDNRNTKSCAIGSIKGNLGHLDRAAGITSFIKTCLVVDKHCIPPVIGFDKMNENINLDNTPFYINKESVLLDEYKDVFAGVTALGVGGTNVHIVLKSTNNIEKDLNTRTKYIIPFSAKCEESLEEEKLSFVKFLKNNNVQIEKMAYVMQTQRRQFSLRESYFVDSRDDLIDALTGKNKKIRRKKVNTIIFNNSLSEELLASLLHSIINEELWVKERIYKRFNLDDNDNITDYFLKHGEEIIRYCMKDCLKEILSEDVVILFVNDENKERINIDDRTIIVKLTEKDDVDLSIKMGSTNTKSFGEIISEIWQSGIDVDWNIYNNNVIKENIHLPGYSFKKTRCWVE